MRILRSTTRAPGYPKGCAFTGSLHGYAAPMDSAIEVRGLVREFKGGIKAVAGIDLDVAAGEIYGFLGPNGAGKSTTVHMLTTLLPPTAGTARVGGFDIVKQGPEVRKTIGAADPTPEYVDPSQLVDPDTHESPLGWSDLRMAGEVVKLLEAAGARD